MFRSAVRRLNSEVLKNSCRRLHRNTEYFLSKEEKHNWLEDFAYIDSCKLKKLSNNYDFVFFPHACCGPFLRLATKREDYLENLIELHDLRRDKDRFIKILEEHVVAHIERNGIEELKRLCELPLDELKQECEKIFKGDLEFALKMLPDELVATYGIEFEFLGVELGGIAGDVLLKLNSLGIKFEGDSSLYADPDQKDYSAEYPTEILRTKQDILKEFPKLKAIIDNDGYINATCGLHVHAGYEEMFDNDDDLLLFFKHLYTNYQTLEEIGLKFPERKTDIPKISDKNHFASDLFSELTDCKSINELDELCNRYNSFRFAVSIRRAKGTIEFRAHSGDITPTNVASWIKLVDSLIKLSIEMTKNNSNAEIFDIYNYNRRLWNMLNEFKKDNSRVG